MGAPVLNFWHDSGLDSRIMQNNYLFRSLSIGIESYHAETGSYPSRIADLVLNTNMDRKLHESMLDVVGLANKNIWHDVYSYQELTNSFILSVRGADVAPLGWFGRQRVVTKQYQKGDAFDAEGQTIQVQGVNP